MTTEQITWHAVADRLPDDDTIVLICADGTAEPVWIGYRDGDDWRDSEGLVVNVTAWAELPAGPK